MSGRMLRVGLCGIELEVCWPQFDGLKARLEGYLRRVCGMVARDGVEVVALGMVDNLASAREAGRRCRREEADLLLLYVATYAVSSTVLPMVQRAGVPAIVLNLQPDAAIDYESFAML